MSTEFFQILTDYEHTRFIIVILTVHLSYKTANCAITVIPTDTEVMVNQPTYLNCSTTITTQEVAWYRYRVGDPYRRHDVYDAGIIDKNYRDRFYIDGDKTKGVYNLVITRVLEEDAGKYECQDNGGIGDKRSAELVVLDSNGPVCQLNTPAEAIVGPNDCNIEPTTLEFSCGVKFHGNIPPQLEWSMKVGSEEKKFPQGNSSYNSTVNEATCNLTVKAEQQINGSSIVCKTTRSTLHQCAVNDVKLSYAFKYGEGVPHTLNDHVTCVANSSQPCTYKWKRFELENDVTIARDSELKAEREGWYRCEAECQFGTKMCYLVAMVIHVFPPITRGSRGTKIDDLAPGQSEVLLTHEPFEEPAAKGSSARGTIERNTPF
jgi:hypothetical protein